MERGSALSGLDEKRDKLRAQERATIEGALRAADWSIGRAATALRISYSSLRARLKKWPELWSKRRKERGRVPGSEDRGASQKARKRGPRPPTPSTK